MLGPTAPSRTLGMVLVVDLETLIAQVWSPDVRPLAEEAWRCYNSGAVRASIATTWTAVTADIITKLIRLADDGDAEAVPFRTNVTDAQNKGLSREGVRAMQNLESTLLDKAAEFELIDSIGVRELERIREDRNLCVHPSLRSLGEVYEPRPEIARGHLAVALTTLLVHPPMQGRKVLEEFKTYICDPNFVPTLPHIQATFFDRVRSAARDNIVKFAAKHALLELPPAPDVPAAEHADRMAIALSAFAQRDRELVRSAVAEQGERFQALEGHTQLRALARLGEQDYFWSIVNDSLALRLQDLLNRPATVADTDPLPGFAAASLAMVRSRYVRDRLPALEARFGALPELHKVGVVAAARPDPYFVPIVLQFIKNAGSFRMGEQAGQLLVQHAPFLTIDDLQSVLSDWCNNTQCRQAGMMPGLAVHLFHGTAHLGPDRGGPFADFLNAVRALEEAGGYYTYVALESAARAAGCIT